MIGQSPFMGHGRLAMRRTGLTDTLGAQFGVAEAFPHPHNVYLEWLLDNGLVGFVPVMLFFAIAVRTSARLFRDRRPWCTAVGGMSLSLILAQLYAGIGSQHFYPRESTLGMWAALFLAFRVDLERQKVRAGAPRRARPAYTLESWREPALS
jgi:O-antigen ligase